MNKKLISGWAMAMKIHLPLLGLIIMVLLSCGSNGVKSNGDENNSKNQDGIEEGDTYPQNTSGTKADRFDRATFDRERQKWLEQGLQNYAFSQVCGYSNGLGQEPSYQYIKNGEARYFRKIERFFDGSETNKDTTDGNTGSGNGTVGYRPGEDLYTTKGRKSTLFGSGSYLSIPITELYTQIDALEKGKLQNTGGTYGIYIQYDNKHHYPSFLFCNSGSGQYLILEIEDLVINPEIPDESNAKNLY
jgi:hypothetical protein